MQQYTRETTTAADGSFVFDHLPPGKYVVNLNIHYEDGKNVTHLSTSYELSTSSVEHGGVVTVKGKEAVGTGLARTGSDVQGECPR